MDRSRTPWLIAVLHVPWYNSNYKHQGEGDAMMRSMEFLLEEANTDLLIAGHVHAYERTVMSFFSIYIFNCIVFCSQVNMLTHHIFLVPAVQGFRWKSG